MAPLDRFCHSTGRRLWYCRCAWRWTAAPLGAQIQGKSNSLNQRFSWFSWEPDTSCSLNHHLPNLGDRSVFQIHKMCKILIFLCCMDYIWIGVMFWKAYVKVRSASYTSVWVVEVSTMLRWHTKARQNLLWYQRPQMFQKQQIHLGESLQISWWIKEKQSRFTPLTWVDS